MTKESKNTLERLCETKKALGISTLMDRGERTLVVFLCSEIDKLKDELAELKGALKPGGRQYRS